MTLEANRDGMTTEDDLKTTVPNIRADKWEMPEPVFRKTSGRLPESLAQKPQQVKDAEPESSIPSTPDTQPKSPTLKIVIVVVALAAMIAFIAVFLTAVYFMFLR